MRRIISYFYLFLLLISSLLYGQPNQWIDFNQDYIKLKIAEDGFYRVTSIELEAVGFPSNLVAASRIRLFRKGIEAAIRVQPNPDGTTLDYFEFWGKKNDGTSDTELYLPNAQAHPYYNLFSDTAT